MTVTYDVYVMVSSTVLKSNVHKSAAMIYPWNLTEDCNFKHNGVAWSLSMASFIQQFGSNRKQVINPKAR
jgi:hypothetical protein